MRTIIGIICFLALLFTHVPLAFATEKACNWTPDFDKNLEHLIDWCEKHHVPEAECDELLDSAQDLTAADFRAKLYNLHSQTLPDNPLPESLTHGTAPRRSTLSPMSEANWNDIPPHPAQAFQRLTELSATASTGFAKKIEFEKHASKYFDTLNAAEIRHVFQVIEKMKSSKTKAELELFLKSKQGHHLKGLGDKYCSGKDVYSLRLSEGTRMCFQYNAEDAIKILCIGQGRHCYNH